MIKQTISIALAIASAAGLSSAKEILVGADHPLKTISAAAELAPMKIDIDYFGKPRDPANPGAGPFAGLKPGKHKIKVWPKPPQSTKAATIA